MKKINLLFEFNIPVTLREYRFFEIDKNHKYIDDYELELTTIQIVNNSIKPFLSLVENTFFHLDSPASITLSMNGSTLNLLNLYAPEIITEVISLQTKGYVELCSTLFTNSILANKPAEFNKLIHEHLKIEDTLFGKVSKNFNLVNQTIDFGTLNELIQLQPSNIYLSEDQAYTIHNSPASVIITDSALSNQLASLLGKSTNGFGDISKVASFLDEIELRSSNKNNTLIHFKPDLNNYSIGISQQVIFQDIIEGIIERNYTLNSSETKTTKDTTYPFDIVFHKQEWHNLKPEFNEMQTEIIDLMCQISEDINHLNNTKFLQNWFILQDDINIKYISSEYLDDNYSKHHHSPYNSPYQAFMNLINILSDFETLVKHEVMQLA